MTDQVGGNDPERTYKPGDGVQRDGAWHDPTHGRIDRDIQDAVDEMHPTSVGQWMAIARTLQDRRDGGRR